MNLFLRIINCNYIFILLFVCDISIARTDGYRIGPRDVITLTIYAGGELQNQVDLTVSGKGTINVPFIGPVRASGFTIMELAERISKPLTQDYFVNPEVNISIKEYHSLRYFISGAVKSPGLYEMTSRATLLELIAKAGGVVPERGNVAYIQRKSRQNSSNGKKTQKWSAGKDTIRVDLKKLLDQGDMTQNQALESGDVVYIPLEKAFNLAESKVYVEGEVESPGVIDYRPGLTALNACIMAGGFSKFAAPNRTRVIRQEGDKQIVIKINLNDVKKGDIADVELKPGDLIHVPETWL